MHPLGALRWVDGWPGRARWVSIQRENVGNRGDPPPWSMDSRPPCQGELRRPSHSHTTYGGWEGRAENPQSGSCQLAFAECLGQWRSAAMKASWIRN